MKLSCDRSIVDLSDNDEKVHFMHLWRGGKSEKYAVKQVDKQRER